MKQAGSSIGSTRRRARGRGLAFPVALTAVMVTACSDGTTPSLTGTGHDLATPWRTVFPGEVGLDPKRLLAAGERAGEIDRMRSLLVVRRGRLAYERYYHGSGPDDLADVRSVTKSVIGTLVGIAIGEGHIDGVDQPVTELLPGGRFALQPKHEEVTVGHLLTMTSGMDWEESGAVGYNDWIRSGDHVDYLLARGFEADPGTHFDYNSAAVHLLGVALQEAVGTSLRDFAAAELFGPIGVETAAWEPLDSEYVNGGAGLDLRPRDLARLGQLYLQGGRSDGAEVVPEAWVQSSITPQVPTVATLGGLGTVSYGLLWWVDDLRGAAFALGYGGQVVYVDPTLDLVVVTTTEWRGVSEDIGSEELITRVFAVIAEGVLPAVR